MVVKLTVRHDGLERAAPEQITLTFDKHSVQIPLRDGTFEVPPQAAGARKISFAARVGDDQILIPDLSGTKLTQENWTLLLAERDYDEGYQWAVPKGSDIPATCILVFDSARDRATFVFYSHCRAKLARESAPCGQ